MREMPIHPTKVGHASDGENQFYGFAVGAELAGQETLAGMVSLAISGQRRSAAVCAVLDDIAVVLTSADPRIWPLKITRVVSSYGRVMPAFAASCGWFQDAVVGYWQSGRLAQTLVDWKVRGLDGNDPTSSAQLRAEAREFGGIGVLLRERDEKYTALRDRLKNRGRLDGSYIRLLEHVGALAGRQPNSFGGVAAAMLDLGFQPNEIGPLATFLVLHTLMANAVEGANTPSGTLRTLPPGCIEYKGRPPRDSPRRRSAGQSAPPPP